MADPKSIRVNDNDWEDFKQISSKMGLTKEAAFLKAFSLLKKEELLEAHPELQGEMEKFMELTTALTNKFTTLANDYSTTEERIRAKVEKELADLRNRNMELNEKTKAAEEQAKRAAEAEKKFTLCIRNCTPTRSSSASCRPRSSFRKQSASMA